MNELWIYLIKVNAALIVFYLFFRLLFRRDTFWKVRRLYLLGSILFAFIYPFIPLDGWMQKQEPIMTVLSAIQLDEFVVQASPERPMFFTTENIAWTIYGIVAMFLLLKMMVQLISILRWRIKGEKQELDGTKIIRLNEEMAPFSFFNLIFINPNLHSEAERAEILAHEETHVRQWHSVDVLIARMQTVVCWFNPASWLIEREIRYNLEFLADNQVLQSGFEVKHYQYHLIKLTYGLTNNYLTNQFNILSIKKRISMMNLKKTKKRGLLKYALLIPIAFIILLVGNIHRLTAAISEQQSKEKQDEIVVVGYGAQEEKAPEHIVVGYTDVGAKEQEKQEQPPRKAYDIVEVMPVFIGGDKALYEYLAKNIVYPVVAQESGIQGRVIVKFIVKATGEISDVHIIRGVDPALDAEAVRVISTMPAWKPGEQNGKKVDVFYTLPIQFKLSGGKTDTPAPAKPAEENVKIDSKGEKVYSTVEIPPKFEGGDQAMFKYLAESIKYPADAQKQKIQGRVIVGFVVKSTGDVADVKVIRGVSPELDKEALRVVSAMPAWQPGKQDGQAVNVSYVLPIQFKLQ